MDSAKQTDDKINTSIQLRFFLQQGKREIGVLFHELKFFKIRFTKETFATPRKSFSQIEACKKQEATKAQWPHSKSIYAL